MQTALCQAWPLYPPLFTQRESCERAVIGSLHGLHLCALHLAQAKRAPGSVNVWRAAGAS